MRKNSSWRSAAAVLALTTATFVQGCGSSDDNTNPTGSIALTISSSSASVQQGSSTTLTGTLTRTDFTGAVTVTVEGAPTGVTGTVVPLGDAATVTISAASTTVPGVYPLTVRAHGTGLSTDDTKPFTLTVTAAPAQTFTLIGTPASVSVAQGATLTTGGLKATRAGGFAGTITYSITGAPTGVTATFAPTAVADSTQLSVTATSGVAVGTYPVLIHGVSGTLDVTTPLTVVVTAAATSGFTLLGTPVSLSVAQGATVLTGGVKATRTGGFAGTITYSISGAPAGVTATFTPTATTDSTQVSITATGAVAPGTYPIVIHGVSGTLDVTTPLSVVVTAGTSGNSTVRLDYSACLAAGRPVWVAFQDGSGAWTRVTGSGDVYTFNINSAKGAIAVVTPLDLNFATNVTYGSQAELVGNIGGCGTPTTTKIVNGSVAGLSAGDLARLSLGGSATSVATNTTFALPAVANGTFDLVGYRRNAVTPGASDRGLLRRDQNITAGGTLGVADFGGAESFAAATANVTVSGLGAGDQVLQQMNYLTGASCTLSPLYTATGSTATTFPVFGIPAGQQRATDYHSLTVSDVSAALASRSVTVTFHSLADRNIAFGANLAPTVTNVTGGLAYKRLQATLTLPSDYTTALFSYSDTPGNTVTVVQTAGYLGGNTAVSLALPDFTGASGLTTTWFPASAAAVTYSVSGLAVPLNSCVEGAISGFASMTGNM